MKNILAGLTLAVSATTASGCTELQEKVITDLHKIYSTTPEHRKLCKEGNLLYIDPITYPLALIVAHDGSVGICNKKLECMEEPEWKNKYEEAVSKRSI